MDIKTIGKQAWRLFIAPAKEITEKTDRRRATLLATLLLALLLGLFPTLFGLPKATGVSSVMPFWVMFGGLLVAYLLSRTRHFQWGIWESVIILCLMPVVFSVNDLDYVQSNLTITVVWMVTPLMVGSMVLPRKSAIYLLLAGPVLIASLIFLIPGLTFAALFPSLFFVSAWSLLQTVFLRHTEQLEADRQGQLKETAEMLGVLNQTLHAEIAKRSQVEEILEKQANELQRSNAFLSALSQVAARITVTSDLDSVFTALGTELKLLGINTFIALAQPDSDALLARYVSIDSKILGAMEKIVGLTMGQIPVSTDRPTVRAVVTHKRGIFVPSATQEAESWLFSVPKIILRQVFKLGNIRPDHSLLNLPLVAGDQLVGVMSVWGADIREDDLQTFTIFAGQVGTAIENIRLYERAQQELVERKQAEASLKTSLAEKNVLLKEVHHRVKNNMQVISSLLNLQAGYVTDEQSGEILRDSQNRVRSMALIHEKLYQSENMAQINFAEYLDELVGYLRRAHHKLSEGVEFVILVDDIYLGVDTAVPLGLILNELASNALKHAFALGQKGKIKIQLTHNNGIKRLIVQDNGIGLPLNFDFQATNSLGLQLVYTLVEQLDGRIETQSHNGALFQIEFR